MSATNQPAVGDLLRRLEEARGYWERKDFEKALPLYEQVLPLAEPMLGPDNPLLGRLLVIIAGMKASKGESDAAITLLERALAIVEKDKTADDYQSGQAAIFLSLGTNYKARHEFAKARAFLEKSLEIEEQISGRESRNVLSIVKALADLEDDPKQQRQANPPSAAAVARVEALQKEALALFQAGKFSEARASARQAAEASERAFGVSSTNFAYSLEVLAGTFKALGDVSNALALCETSLRIKEHAAGPEHPDVATPLFELATLHDAAGNYALALALCQRCLQIKEQALGRDHRDVGAVLVVLGGIYMHIGDYQKASEINSRALAICDKNFTTDPYTAIACLIQLAFATSEAGFPESALKMNQAALALYERFLGPEHPHSAAVLNNLAAVYEQLGDPTNALALYRRSLDVRERSLGKNHPDLAPCLCNLGSLYRNQGNRSLALALYQRAVTILEKAVGPRHSSVALALNGMSLVYEDEGDYPTALRLLNRSLEIVEGAFGKEHPNVAVVLNNIASVYDAQGRSPEALEMDKRSLAIYDRSRGATWPAVIRCLRNIATLEMERGNMAEAIPPATQAFRLQREYLLLRHQQATDREALLAASRYSADNDLFHTACGISAAARLAVGHASGAEQLALSKALLEEVRIAQASLEADTTTRGLREQRQAVQAQMRRLSESGLDSGERESRLKTLEEDLRQTEAKLSERNLLMNQARLERELSLADIARDIPRETGLLDFVQYRRCDFTAKRLKEPRYAAYLTFPLDKDSTNVVVERVDLGVAAPIDAAVATITKRMSAGQFAASDLSNALQRVSELVYGPLARHLTNAAHLIVCPDGQLSRVPFEMLRYQGRFLVEEKIISYVGSGREIVRLSPKSKVQSPKSDGAASKSLVMGNPDFDLDLAKAGSSRREETLLNAERGMRNAELSQSLLTSAATRSLSRDYRGFHFDPLPEAEAEARNVAKLLGADCVLRLGAEAREAELKAVVSPRVLHLATHGFFLSDQEFNRTNALRDSWTSFGAQRSFALPQNDWENPLVRCGIALAGANHARQITNAVAEDGLLTGLEASLLNLQGTELVILSACQSGEGEVKIGEGVMSLRRAFRIAGAQSVLASHWKVSDEATRQLMTEFMRRWRAGEPRGQAWREAQLSLLRSEKFSNPYFWAAFTLTGQWN